MSMSEARIHNIGLADCKISKVVVFKDQAEVTRSFQLKQSQAGENTVIIGGLTSSAVLDMVCVKPLEVGRCFILEVSHEDVVIHIADENTNDVHDLGRLELSKEEQELQVMLKRKQRVEASIRLLDSYAQASLKSQTNCSIDNARSVIEYHEKELERLDGELMAVSSDISRKEVAISKLKGKLGSKSSISHNHSVLLRKALKIALEVRDETQDVNISFSYIVSGATWVPSYDIRVNTTPENSLAISYFGEVTQSTGEDWLDTDISLSTSNPALSVEPPPVPTIVAEFQQRFSYRNSSLRNDEDTRNTRAGSFASLDEIGGFPGQMRRFEVQQQREAPRHDQTVEFKKAAIEGTGDAGSTVFTITRKVSVASDNKPHKVMITARRFTPQLIHYCVPSVSPYVYIQAKTKNNSLYPLLASSKVNIYLDGNFISKSAMKQANSGETFQLYLGVDPSIKVEYLPTRYEEYKKGWISGSAVKKVYHKTVVNNTKATPCRIILTDALPISHTEKIVVEIMEPAASSLVKDASKVGFSNPEEAFSNIAELNGSGGSGVDESDGTSSSNPAATSTATIPEFNWPNDFQTLNKSTNHIVWFKTIKGGEKIEVPFTYRLSWPQGSNVFLNDS